MKSLDAIVVEMMNAASAPLVLVNSERRLLWSNKPAAALLESEVDHLAGIRIEEVLASTPEAIAELCKSISARGHQSGVIDLLTRSGQTRATGFTAISIATDLHLSVLRDVPARVTAAGRRELGPLPAVASERQPASARLAAAVGHEIRAPLATALMYLDIAERGMTDAGGAGPAGIGPVVGAMGVARQQIQRVENLVSRMMEMERFGRAQIRASWVDAGRVVSDAVRRTMAGEIAARVVVEIGADKLIDWWDETALEQIVQNLLSNAVKFGEGRPIHVMVEAGEGGVRLSVQDNGVGISVADRERIFRRHVRAPRERAGGLGLGLWLVRQLAEAHSGAVSVQSQPGMGSIFTVTLRPLRPAEPARRA